MSQKSHIPENCTARGVRSSLRYRNLQHLLISISFCVTTMSYEQPCVSNHRHCDCLFNGLFMLTTKKTSKLRIACPSWNRLLCTRSSRESIMITLGKWQWNMGFGYTCCFGNCCEIWQRCLEMLHWYTWHFVSKCVPVLFQYSCHKQFILMVVVFCALKWNAFTFCSQGQVTHMRL